MFQFHLETMHFFFKDLIGHNKVNQSSWTKQPCETTSIPQKYIQITNNWTFPNDLAQDLNQMQQFDMLD